MPLLVRELNARFHRSPYRAAWTANGNVADAGVLHHAFDRRENAGKPWHPWLPDPGEAVQYEHLKQSGSLIYHGQNISNRQIPHFNGEGSGLIMRPSANRIFCGFGGDAGGKGACIPAEHNDCVPGCQQQGQPEWCDPVEVKLEGGQAGTCYDRPWQPGRTLGILFKRAAGNAHYNEIIIDAVHWDAHLPLAVEGIYYTKASSTAQIREAQATHAGFLRQYGLSEEDNPLLVVDRDDWDAPFRAHA